MEQGEEYLYGARTATLKRLRRGDSQTLLPPSLVEHQEVLRDMCDNYCR